MRLCLGFMAGLFAQGAANAARIEQRMQDQAANHKESGDVGPENIEVVIHAGRSHMPYVSKKVAKKPLFPPSTELGTGFANIKSNSLAAEAELCWNYEQNKSPRKSSAA
jgi:hypothetical protein